MRGARSWFLSLAALLALPATSSAGVLVPSAPLASGTNSVAVGADGNLWAGEEFASSVVRVSPSGAPVLPRFSLPGSPARITTGPGGTIWVAVPSARKIVWFDAMSATPTAHEITTGGPGTCGPIAVVDGGNGRVYYSTPSDGACSTPNRLGAIDAGTKTVLGSTPNEAAGIVFDLEVANGKLFAPDFGSGVIRRFSLGSPPVIESTIALPPANVGSAPDGITATGDGALWVTLFSSGQLARFPASQSGGEAQVITPNGGALDSPFGIVASPYGGVLVASKGNASLVRVQADGTTEAISLGTGAQPFDLVAVPGGAWVSDNGSPRLVHLVDALPTANTVSATATGPTTATFAGTFDTGGNEAQVSFEYGLTTAYGSATAASALAASAGGAAPAGASVGLLSPATTYHVRARVTTVRGTAVGPDLTFTTAAAPGAVIVPSPPRVKATITAKSKVKGSTTTITSLVVKGLVGGETITIACAAKKRGICPFKKATEKKVKKGSRALTKRFGAKHPVRVGATITITVSAAGKTPAKLTLAIRKGKKPKSIAG